MKHAYLLLAHHEFEVLKYLVAALDDVRNDIFIHFDRKVKQLPLIKTSQARLIILERRIDVRWGDISVVEAEFLLFEEAIQQKSNYSYYHLLSGVDMPLKSQDYLHDFFLRHNGKQFIGYYQGEQHAHIERKVNLYHLFPRHFRDDKSLSNFFMKILRYLWIRTQILFHLKRNKGIAFKKGTQWVSLTNDFVRYMLTQRDHVFKTYQNTFCSDEIVVQTICWNSPFQASIYDKVDESNGSQRAIQWIDNQIYDWELKDLQILLSSKLLFARKFNGNNIDVVHKILNKVSDQNQNSND